MPEAWWKERVFYQIYPRSFQDSNGDGIGDLRGIISRLDYLKSLDVGAVWLCPVYDSPNADMGYDIRDYEKIMAEFGTMEDFDELLREMRRRCFDGRDCMCVGETSSVNTENANSLVGDGRELDLLFQFDLMDMDGEGSKWNAIPLDVPKLKRIVAAWQGAIDWNTLFLGNHDQPRVVSRFGDTSSEELWKRSAKCLATLMYLQRGTPFIYQGEELGMTNAPFETREQLRDVEELNLLALCSSEAELEWAWRGIKAKGRDNARTPMQWSAGENADFTTGEPWIMLNPNYTDINAEAEEGNPDSVLNYYRALIALRNSTPALLRGDWWELLPESGQVVAYTRGLDGEEYAVLCNLSRESAPLPCRLGDFGEPVLSNMPADPAAETLRPYEAQVLKKG